MATNMAKKNVSVNKIAYILGHEKISTTQEYLVNNEVDVENSYRLCFEWNKLWIVWKLCIGAKQ